MACLELAEGLDKQFVVNDLSHFILVNRLLDQVQTSQQGRIVMVSSGAHRGAPPMGIDFDNLSGQRYYESWQSYSQSKMANGVFAMELARRLTRTRATANVLDPGGIATERGMEVTRRTDPMLDYEKAIRNGAKTVPQGAATTCYVATDSALAKVSGEYFADCDVAKADDRMRDAALARKLWEVSERLTQAYLLRSA